ncbi:MAG: N-acetylglucosamine-6-phosphate deacetylase, partial [Candidatus Firestonebacteria bacterium]
GTHLEGPFINIKKKGMIRPDGILRPSVKIMKMIEKASQGTLKMMTIAPELKGTLPLVKRFKKAGIVAAVGHTYASYEETKAGLKAGITHATHLFNAMPPLHHREPGVLGALAADKTATVQVIADGVHLHPAVLKIIYKIFGADRICLITDGLSPLGLGDGEYTYHGIKYSNRKGTCYYYNGTLIGTALPLNQAAKRMQSYTGASFEEIIRMLSTTPAKTLGNKSKGVLKTGKDADIAVIDGNFKVYAALSGGKVVFNG